MANAGVAVLAVAALALFAASKKKKNGEAVPEPQLEPEGGETTEPVVVDKDMYYGQGGTAVWMIFKEPDGMFTWVWRRQIRGPESSWPAFSGGPAPSQQAAGDELMEDLFENLGEEGPPGIEDLAPMPGEEPPVPEFDVDPYTPGPQPGEFDPVEPVEGDQ